jgi:hypothetical protein
MIVQSEVFARMLMLRFLRIRSRGVIFFALSADLVCSLTSLYPSPHFRFLSDLPVNNPRFGAKTASPRQAPPSSCGHGSKERVQKRNGRDSHNACIFH